VYFVARQIDVTRRSGQKLLCSRFSPCDDQSLSNTLEAERKRYLSSFLAEPPASWVDDFFQWLNPVLETCCRVRIKDPSVFCAPEDSDFICQPCYVAESEQWNITMEGFPQDDAFMRYVRQWLQSPTDENCPLGGQAAYSTAVSLHANRSVRASHFRTFHTPLKSQNDYIDAMGAADRIAADFSEKWGAEVFPYSLFYVFFDQYSTIVSTTRSIISLACFAIFLVTAVFLGSIRTSLIVTLTVFSTTLNVMGIMGVWHISLNAISLVNLLISCGIAVEFCSHVARSFMSALGGGLPFSHPSSAKERDERAWASLSDVGASVFTGITLTKLIGVSVLAITRSQLLKVCPLLSRAVG
jgi:Niemann-Pick C1 protein